MSATDDGRSPAVVEAGRGTERWADAVRIQRVSTPDHADFYALARESVSTLSELRNLAAVLRPQVQDYSQGRRLYDDTRGTVTPEERLAVAGDALVMLINALDMADKYGQRFWSAIGHIGVED